VAALAAWTWPPSSTTVGGFRRRSEPPRDAQTESVDKRRARSGVDSDSVDDVECFPVAAPSPNTRPPRLLDDCSVLSAPPPRRPMAASAAAAGAATGSRGARESFRCPWLSAAIDWFRNRARAKTQVYRRAPLSHLPTSDATRTAVCGSY